MGGVGTPGPYIRHPIPQSTRPSMTIFVKNGCNNGGRGGESRIFGWVCSGWEGGGRTKEVLYGAHNTTSSRLKPRVIGSTSLSAQGTSWQWHFMTGLDHQPIVIVLVSLPVRRLTNSDMSMPVHVLSGSDKDLHSRLIRNRNHFSIFCLRTDSEGLSLPAVCM
jgi:hypothetical protein